MVNFIHKGRVASKRAYGPRPKSNPEDDEKLTIRERVDRMRINMQKEAARGPKPSKVSKSVVNDTPTPKNTDVITDNSSIKKLAQVPMGYDRLLRLFELPPVSDEVIKVTDHDILKQLNARRGHVNGMTLSDFKSFIKGKSIAIIANSNILLKGKYGSLIDEHDIVIRFNSYAIEPKYTGSKTTMHVSIYLQNVNLDKNVPMRCIISNSQRKWITKMFSLDKCKQGLFLKYNSYFALLKGIPLTRDALTTGFQIILLLKLLGGYDRVSIYGFDGYKDGKDSILRTKGGEKYPISTSHSYDVESRVLYNTADLVDKVYYNYVYYGNRTL